MKKQFDVLDNGKFLSLDKSELIGLGAGIGLGLAVLFATGFIKDSLFDKPTVKVKQTTSSQTTASKKPSNASSTAQPPTAQGQNNTTANTQPTAQAKPLTTPPTAIVASSPTDKMTAEEIVTAVKQLQNCSYKPQDPACGIRATQEGEIAREINNRIGLHIHQLVWLIQNDQAKGINAAELSRSLIKVVDTDIQRTSLELMSLSSPDPKNVDAIIGNISKSRDPETVYQALIELQRYPAPYLKDKIDNFLLNTIESGYPSAAQEIARNVIPFLNARNIEKFRTLAQRLPPMSARSKYLKIALDNYYIVEDEGSFGR